MDFPIISLKHFSSQFDEISENIFKASQEWGFFIVKDYESKARDFFDLPIDIKSKKILNEDPVGYDGHTATTFAASEGMSFGLPAGQLSKSDNIHSWWDRERLAETEAFKAQCNDLNLMMLSCFAVHMGLPKDFFEASHSQALPGNTFKLIKYPKMEEQPRDLIPRLSEHTDWGSLTLLFTESPGLEVRDPSNQWHEVPVIPGAVTVNIGDALSLWTRKQLKSTMHRISWGKLPRDQDRYSMPYFVHPNLDTNLRLSALPNDANGQPLKYRDYFKVRLRLTWGSVEQKDGTKVFGDVDSKTFKYLSTLGVANAGILESHTVNL
ncbi:hypothetical protein LT330_006342 [Penicillium expansum]|nr:hypothetical protein LT330_006342 [Penicillium expansum]